MSFLPFILIEHDISCFVYTHNLIYWVGHIILEDTINYKMYDMIFWRQSWRLGMEMSMMMMVMIVDRLCGQCLQKENQMVILFDLVQWEGRKRRRKGNNIVKDKRTRVIPSFLLSSEEKTFGDFGESLKKIRRIRVWSKRMTSFFLSI